MLLLELWGGPPGPRPAFQPACRGLALTREKLVQKDPRGPGSPPYFFKETNG